MLLFHLSAMAPETMVVAVVAKDIWNRKVVNTGPMSSPEASTKYLKQITSTFLRSKHNYFSSPSE